MRDSSFIDVYTDSLYSISIALSTAGKSFFDIDSLQEAKIRAIAASSSKAKILAEAVLENVKGDEYVRIPELMDEGRFMNPSVQQQAEPVMDNVMLITQPNPFTETTTIFYKADVNASNKAEIKIYDMVGKLIKNFILTSGQGSFTVNLQGFNEGIYYCHLIMNGEKIKSQKLIMIK